MVIECLTVICEPLSNSAGFNKVVGKVPEHTVSVQISKILSTFKVLIQQSSSITVF